MFRQTETRENRIRRVLNSVCLTFFAMAFLDAATCKQWGVCLDLALSHSLTLNGFGIVALLLSDMFKPAGFSVSLPKGVK